MRVATLCIVALSICGCNVTGPKENLSGYWVARSIGHSEVVGLMLLQNGDAITGTACSVSDGVLLYKDAPVFGDYPDVQFTVGASQTQPCCPNMAGAHFSGTHDSTKNIVGTYSRGDLRFERAITPACK
jgi:hypothetical protein